MTRHTNLSPLQRQVDKKLGPVNGCFHTQELASLLKSVNTTLKNLLHPNLGASDSRSEMFEKPNIQMKLRGKFGR